MTDLSTPESLLTLLKRYESQVISQRDHRALVELFCVQIIPFFNTHRPLAPLRAALDKSYLQLEQMAQAYEKEALGEVTEVLEELEKRFKRGNASIKEKIAHIRRILKRDPQTGFMTCPLSQRVYFELKALLQLALEQGKETLCARFAKIGRIQQSIHSPNKSCIVEVPPYRGLYLRSLCTESNTSSTSTPLET